MLGIEVPFTGYPENDVIPAMLLFVALPLGVENDAAIFVAEVDPEWVFGAARDRVIEEGLIFNQRHIVA